MLTRIVFCVLGCVLLVGPVAGQPQPREDAVKAEVEKLRAQAQALLAQAQALEAQARQAKSEREAAEKYLRELADSCLEAILKGDAEDVAPLLSKEIRENLVGGRTQLEGNLNVVRRRGIAVSSYKIISSAIAPSGEEALFRAEVSGKIAEGNEKGKDKTATVTLRVQKENGRYVLGFLSATVRN